MTIFQLGLIGYPLDYSLSPKIHNAALRACGLQGNYSLFPVSPDDKQGMKDSLARVRSGEIAGLNVTIPHKQNVIPLMDELTPAAKAIGAVNTIYFKEKKLIGDNTDAPGFLSDLKKFVAIETQSLGELNALVLGAGGSARAVVYALLNDGWTVTIIARRLEQAQRLASSFTQNAIHTANYSDLRRLTLRQAQGNAFDLLVNTIPLGMTPNIDQSPLPDNLSLPSNTFIYDLVYNPRETKLVRDARSHGLQATTGFGMLIEQAALSFELWTGNNPSREIMRGSIEQSPVSSF